MVAADVHLAFVVELYKLQMEGGRYFLHENPQSARGWARPSTADLMRDERVNRVVGDQCQYGQETFKGHSKVIR